MYFDLSWRIPAHIKNIFSSFKHLKELIKTLSKEKTGNRHIQHTEMHKILVNY